MALRGESLRTLGRFCGALGLVIGLSIPLTLAVAEGVGPLLIGKAVLAAVLGGVYLLTHGGRVAWRGRASLMLWLQAGSAVMAAVILVAVNILAALYPIEWDVTSEKIHSLAPPTAQVLDNLQQPVTVYAFYNDQDAGAFTTRELLRRYAARSKHLELAWIDPDLRPDLVDELEIRKTGPRVVVKAGDRAVKARGSSEQEITNALVEATRAWAGTVAFVTGHGEADPQERDGTGYELAAQALQEEGYRWRTLRLLDQAGPQAALQVPEDISVLVVASPRSAWMEAELRALETYLESGGRVLLMLEPHVQTGLESVARTWKIDVQDNIVADSVSQMLGLGWSGPVIQVAPRPHPITEPLVAPVVMKTVRSLRVLEAGPPRIEAQPLVQTGRSAWGERGEVRGEPTLSEGDDPPPLVVGAVATGDFGDGHAGHGHAHTGQDHQGRLVVFGDGDWMNNRLGAQQGNTDLFLNTVNWLAQRPEKITIRPRQRARSEMALTPQDLSMLRVVSLDILPVLLIALGAGVVWIRRRR